MELAGGVPEPEESWAVELKGGVPEPEDSWVIELVGEPWPVELAGGLPVPEGRPWLVGPCPAELSDLLRELPPVNEVSAVGAVPV